MCLAIPGQVKELFDDDGLLMGRVNFNGITKKVCFESVPDAKPGDYVIVHVGFALTKVNEVEAKRVFELLEELGELRELGDFEEQESE